MKCISCNEEKFNLIHYDRHVFELNYKFFVRNFLKKIDFIIPNSNFFNYLKKLSQNVFKGKIAVCKNCGFGEALNKPAKDHLKNYYNKFYWQNFRNQKSGNLKNISFNKNIRAIQQFNFIKNNCNLNLQKSILEVGGGSCCTSLLLRENSNQNNDLSCCDSIFWAEYYEQNNINFIDKYFPFIQNKKYDLILSSHQLEHVDDLVSNINGFRSLLNDNGFLFIEVPNTPEIYWKRYIIDTPHLFFFTKKSLINIFQRQNFKLIDVVSFGNTYDEILKKKRQDYNVIRDDGAYLKAIFKKC